ncbi:MAG: hypothetical protein K2X00_18820 [Nitrospiraceae bacterium]|nr:hypothetical protein [Nitrospiraceae bacterium]
MSVLKTHQLRTVGAIAVFLCFVGQLRSADSLSLTIRVYDRRTAMPIENLSAEDVRIFAGRQELTVTSLQEAKRPLDIWLLANHSPAIRDALGDPGIANEIFGGLGPSDKVHFRRVCAEPDLEDEPVNVSTLRLKSQAALAGSSKKEPVITCLVRFGQHLQQKPGDVRRHLILLADDALSSSSFTAAVAEQVSRLGATVSIVHWAHNRKRSRRGNWGDVPISPPPQAPLPTVEPPKNYPDHNNFELLADYTGGELIRVESAQRWRLGELVEGLRREYVVSFVPSSSTGAGQSRYLSIALSERGVLKHPTAVFRFPHLTSW